MYKFVIYSALRDVWDKLEDQVGMVEISFCLVFFLIFPDFRFRKSSCDIFSC